MKALGGSASAVSKAREFVRARDLPFAATLLGHSVFAEPARRKPSQLLTQAREKPAYATDNAHAGGDSGVRRCGRNRAPPGATSGCRPRRRGGRGRGSWSRRPRAGNPR
ncbi:MULTISPECIES: alkyl sulfatase dimerization domain-containing protein [unclassified Streptomyces]|uniref:alkyl sulfatase dimerization domain-containing protein n=1 Tax=unclassified Streptomyces TaxID=2593676 RepID=UPI00386B1AB5